MIRLFLPSLLLAVSGGLFAADTLTNEDIAKLSKAGMSESFILNAIQSQPGEFITDAARLVELKQAGVSEPVIRALTRKSAPKEALNSDSVMRLVKAGFSEDFLLEHLRQFPGQYSADSERIIELKRAGVSEAVITAMLKKAGTSEIPSGTQIRVRLIDSIDSEKAKAGDEFRASLDEALVIGGDTVAPRGADATVKLAAEKESGKITGTPSLTVELVGVQIRGKMAQVATDDFTQEGQSRTKQTAKRSAILGGVGAVIGAIAGGGKGAAIGAGAGAGAGVGTQVITKGAKVSIPSETVLTFVTKAPVKF